MCLIMQINDKEVGITQEEFKANIKKNPHGTGVMFVNNNRIIVKKELENEEKQIKLFDKYTESVRKGGIRELFIHSRLATHGAKDEFNCHPYEVLNKTENNGVELYCMHNGVIRCEQKETNKSDTYNFLAYYVKPLLVNRLELLENEHFIEMLSDFIGTGSKLVFLDSTGKSYFVNRKQGTEYGKVWLSNTYSGINGYKKPPAHTQHWKDREDNEDFLYGFGRNSPHSKKTNTTITKIVNEILPKTNNLPLAVNKQNEVINLNNSKKKEGSLGVLCNEEESPFESKAIEHGIKLLICACRDMSQEEVFNFVLAEPLIAAELIAELLEDTEIVLGV